MSESADTKELVLPVSGKKVVVRTYTTRREDKRAEEITNKGMTVRTENDKEVSEIDLQAIADAKTLYVEALVQSVDGETKSIPELLGDLRSEDYQHIEDFVDTIVSPVKTPKGTSKSS